MAEIYVFMIKDKNGVPYLSMLLRSKPDSDLFVLNGRISPDSGAMLERRGTFSEEFGASLPEQGSFWITATGTQSVDQFIHNQVSRGYRYFGTGEALGARLELVNEASKTLPFRWAEMGDAVRNGYTKARFGSEPAPLPGLSPRLTMDPVWA